MKDRLIGSGITYTVLGAGLIAIGVVLEWFGKIDSTVLVTIIGLGIGLIGAKPKKSTK